MSDNAPNPTGAQPPGTATVPKWETIPFALVEEYYKKPGGSLVFAGKDPLDFWFGPFYVGFWGAFSVAFAAAGAAFYLYEALWRRGTFNILAADVAPPPISAGLRLVGINEPGFFWQMTVICATLAFFGWLMREIDISRKLQMGYEVAICFGVVFSSWVTLQILRPIAMGAWGNGFNLGITAHLDWVSNIGYQYFNFFYNPFHALAIAGLFGTTMLLSMHGGAIRSEMGRPWVTEANIDAFWRGSLGYSIGEIGIHRLGFWAAAISILLANVCIFLSGTLVQDWNAFWSFWDKLPFWSYGALLIGVIAWLPKARKLVDPREAVDLDEVESYKANNLLDSYVGGTVYVPIVDRLFGNGLFGKVYVGVWGVAAGICFLIAVAIILGEYLRQVNYNGLLFVREFAVLSVNPPPANVGLGFAPWQQGGAWQAATFFLTASIGAFWARQFFRARQVGIGRDVAFAFLSAIFLYLVIYIIRPVIMGAWTEAPPHGLQSHLNWVNNLNVRYGNFYYNPFHMISIFFLLGSVMLFGMHGATIVATSRYGSEHEAKEMMAEGPGTHRAQLFWRWVMGWNANSESIHHWCWWFGILCVVAGAIGLLLTGTVVYDWYAWAVNAQIAHRPF